MKTFVMIRTLSLLISFGIFFSLWPCEVEGKNDSSSTVSIRPSIPKIKGVHLFDSDSNIGKLGDQICIVLDDGDFPENLKGQDLILYINNRPYTTIKAIQKTAHNNELQFVLAEEIEAGQKGKLLRQLYRMGNDMYDLNLTIGTADGTFVALPPSDNNYHNFKLILYNKWVLIAGLIFIAAVIITFIALSRNTRIIRDESQLKINMPYSLARTQLAWWTLIIFSSFVFTLCITWDVNQLNSSVVILLGISAATTAAGRLIDRSDKASDAIDERIQDLPGEGFWQDILSDGVNGGVSVHRFQNVIFNLVLGLHFLYTVLNTLEMPTYDGEILALIGISSATYAGLKAYENNGNTAPQPKESTS